MSAMKAAGKAKKKSVFSKGELDAMKETIRERKAGSGDGEKDVVAKLKQMKGVDREAGERIHAMVKELAPHLAPRTWYGMPAYSKNEKVVLFYKPGAKFKVRYPEIGFTDKAIIDDGNMWPTAYAIIKLTAAEESKIAALIRKAAG